MENQMWSTFDWWIMQKVESCCRYSFRHSTCSRDHSLPWKDSNRSNSDSQWGSASFGCYPESVREDKRAAGCLASEDSSHSSHLASFIKLMVIRVVNWTHLPGLHCDVAIIVDGIIHHWHVHLTRLLIFNIVLAFEKRAAAKNEINRSFFLLQQQCSPEGRWWWAQWPLQPQEWVSSRGRVWATRICYLVSLVSLLELIVCLVMESASGSGMYTPLGSCCLIIGRTHLFPVLGFGIMPSLMLGMVMLSALDLVPLIALRQLCQGQGSSETWRFIND